ncbi:MAG: multiheme c-type cytochrome, partial [Gammaproteobacteria bacterium]
IEVRNAHGKERAAIAAYSFNIEDVSFAGPGTPPTVTFAVRNPENNNAPYELEDNAALYGSLRFYVAWDTVDYNNIENIDNTVMPPAVTARSNSQPASTNVYNADVLNATANPDDTYYLELTDVSAVATGTGSVVLVGFVDDPEAGQLRVPSTFRYFSITDPANSPVERRKTVDIQRCNDCHNPMTFHGGARNDSVEACQVCHIPDAARRSNLGPMDMKSFIHRIHVVDDIRYPAEDYDCLVCHVEDGFYPFRLSTGILATSTTRGASETDPTDNNRISPNSAACGVCHSDTGAIAHMEGRGGSFDACQESDGSIFVREDVCGPMATVGDPVTEGGCASCHGKGGSFDTALCHTAFSIADPDVCVAN